MLVPSPRLLLLSATVALPLAAVGGMLPNAMAICAVVLAGCISVVAIDALAALRRAAAFGVRTPASIRLTKDVAATFPVTLDQRREATCTLRLGVNLPSGIQTDSPVIEVEALRGESTVDWPCIARARGDHSLLHLFVEGSSPLGLWLARETRAVELSFRVYPNLRDHATATLFLRTANLGMRVRRQVGKGREFENLRPYLPGDSFEDIHWKATARRSFPTVKLFRVEHAQEVYTIVDASRLSSREGILESFIEAALHLALVTEKQGDRFGLVTFSDRPHKFVRAGNGMNHFRLCRETIYNLRAQRVSPDFREVFTSLQLNLRRRSLLVFFTSLDDALLAETFERDIPLLARRHVVLVNVRRTAALTPLYAGGTVTDLDAVYGGLAGADGLQSDAHARNRVGKPRGEVEGNRSGPNQNAGCRGLPGSKTEANPVIIDVPRFVAEERPYWDELQALLAKLEAEPERRLALAEIERLHYLYERCSSDLFAAGHLLPPSTQVRALLEALVSRAYSMIHETRAPMKIRWKESVAAFPRAFRRHLGAFRLAVGITLLGCAFGWFALHVDPRNKAIPLPFSTAIGAALRARGAGKRAPRKTASKEP